MMMQCNSKNAMVPCSQYSFVSFQLVHEAIVWVDDTSLPPDKLYSLFQRHVVLLHRVGYDL